MFLVPSVLLEARDFVSIVSVDGPIGRGGRRRGMLHAVGLCWILHAVGLCWIVMPMLTRIPFLRIGLEGSQLEPSLRRRIGRKLGAW